MAKLDLPRFEEGRAMMVAGVRQHHSFADSVRSIPDQWDAFRRLGKISGQIGSAAYGVVCGTDPREQRFEYMCGVEVTGFEQLPADLGRMRIPAQRYAVFTHTGHMSLLRRTWEAIWNDWLPASGIRPAQTPDFEVYDERFDPNTGVGAIEIWFPVASD